MRRGWGFVSTNNFPDVKKAHLLEMRRGPNALVFNISPNGNEKILAKYGIKVYGSDWNSYFYSLTIKGFQFVLENYKDIKDVTDEMLKNLFDEVFSENLNEDEWVELRKLN